MGSATATPWRVEKDVCYPGRVVVPGDDGGPVVYQFTPADIAAMHRTGNAKIGDGWNVPVCWEHQNVHPLRKSVHLGQAARDREYAKSVFGSAARFVVRGGRLRAVLEGDDPDDLKQFLKVKHVSPEIVWDWRDTDGKVWRGPTITHIAATPRPVQRHQDRVTTARLSLLAHAGNPGKHADPRLPVLTPRVGFTLRLSHTSYAEPNMADDINTTGTDEGTDGVAGGGKKSAWDRIKAALAGKGIMLGESEIKDESHLADLIEVACLNSADDTYDDEDEEADDANEGDTPPEGDMTQPPPGTSEPPPPPVQMSLEAATKRVEAQHRAELTRQAKKLMTDGTITPAIGNTLVDQIKTVRLSLTATGDLEPNAVTTKIAAYQELEPRTSWSPAGKRGGGKNKGRARLSQTANGKNGLAADAGRSPYAPDGEVDTDAVVNAFFETAGTPAK